MVKLVRIERDNEKAVDLASKFCYSLVKMHAESARTMGIPDRKAEMYSIEDAKKSVIRSGRYSDFVVKDGIIVGYVCYSLNISEDICIIHKLFISEKHRRQGIGSKVILNLLARYQLAIELDCWYTLEAHMFYRRLGFVQKSVRYAIPYEKGVSSDEGEVF